MYKIVIVDTIGLMYDGDTLNKKGLGGSESSVILMSKELVKLGFSVVVYNICQGTITKPGIYDGVEYRHFSQEPTETFDILIASRHVLPFITDQNLFEKFHPLPYSFSFAEKLRKNVKHKVLWMHDTFCRNDDILEDLIIGGQIDEIFTLSDFHTTYVTNCDHGKRRNFEVLKSKVFQTRNGINAYTDWVDVTKKDRNLFVFNASFTKGMDVLVQHIWPEIHKRIPNSKLKIIGGYYIFNDTGMKDKQYYDWYNLKQQYESKNLNIEFTGSLTQKEIAEVFSQASFFIYPATYPETFGISALESLAYNTPLLTCRFGALEETAVDQASYMIDYAVEPNSLFTNINKDIQVSKFVDMVVNAYNDTYLHQQKMNYCNIVKDICTWDTVALQWKQHLYQKLGDYLQVEEYRKVQRINAKVHKVFGRRFANKEQFAHAKSPENRIMCIVPFYNGEQYIEKCIRSIASQDYYNYKVILIDDASTDGSQKVATDTIRTLGNSIQEKFVVLHNDENVGAVGNQINTIRKHCSDTDIIMLIDGDDALYNSPDIFNLYNNLYRQGAEFTYGSCWSLADNIPLIAQPYPPEIKRNKSYRDYKFNWGMPYTHLRTFRKSLVNDLSDDVFKDENGKWYGPGGDNSTFYNIIEQANPDNVIAVPDIVYLYNDTNPINDYKVHTEEQNETAKKAALKKIDDKKFSVIVATMWKVNHIFMPFLFKLLEEPLVGEVIIINNDPKNCLGYPNHKKLKVLDFGENIFVNPAFNVGVKNASYDRICIFGDDFTFDLGIFDKIKDRITTDVGLHGVNLGRIDFNQTPITDGSIQFEEYKTGDYAFGYFNLFFLHRRNWSNIPETIKIYFGDNYMFEHQLSQGRKNYFISNMDHTVEFGLTTKTIPDIHEIFRQEEIEWFKIRSESGFDKLDMSVKPRNTKKKILIAIPTAKYIEPDTFKSIYDLKIPDDCHVEFQYFYGYRVDQIRNLIVDWVIKGYDYLFSVDSDITFPPDTLEKLLNYDKDLISATYIQRKHEHNLIELYGEKGRLEPEDVSDDKLIPITACGFGCVLVKKHVFEKINYPHFEYHVSLDHEKTFSEDHDFCRKIIQKGISLWADTGIKCGHIGSYNYKL